MRTSAVAVARAMVSDMTADSPRHDPHNVPEESIPLVVSVAWEHVPTLERWAARRGITGMDLLEEFVTRAFGPLGARIER